MAGRSSKLIARTVMLWYSPNFTRHMLWKNPYKNYASVCILWCMSACNSLFMTLWKCWMICMVDISMTWFDRKSTQQGFLSIFHLFVMDIFPNSDGLLCSSFVLSEDIAQSSMSVDLVSDSPRLVRHTFRLAFLILLQVVWRANNSCWNTQCNLNVSEKGGW